MAVTITAAVLLTRMAVAGHGDAHALQHVGQALGGEHGLAAVARAGQADDQPVADQLVFADAFDGDEVFQAGGRQRSAANSNREQQ